jgi:hypothetical protein
MRKNPQLATLKRPTRGPDPIAERKLLLRLPLLRLFDSTLRAERLDALNSGPLYLLRPALHCAVRASKLAESVHLVRIAGFEGVEDVAAG